MGLVGAVTKSGHGPTLLAPQDRSLFQSGGRWETRDTDVTLPYLPAACGRHRPGPGGGRSNPETKPVYLLLIFKNTCIYIWNGTILVSIVLNLRKS